MKKELRNKQFEIIYQYEQNTYVLDEVFNYIFDEIQKKIDYAQLNKHKVDKVI